MQKVKLIFNWYSIKYIFSLSKMIVKSSSIMIMCPKKEFEDLKDFEDKECFKEISTVIEQWFHTLGVKFWTSLE